MFLDRDGVIIENRSDYVKSWEEVRFLPGVFEALRRLARSEYALAIVTNQSAVGRGIISLDEAMHINERVLAEIAAQGGRVDASYMCPHRPDEGCNCRKPAPGMLLQAAEDLELVWRVRTSSEMLPATSRRHTRQGLSLVVRTTGAARGHRESLAGITAGVVPI